MPAEADILALLVVRLGLQDRRRLHIVVEDRAAAIFQPVEDGGFFDRDACDVLERLQVHFGDGGDERDMRAGHAGERRDLSRGVHANLDHGVVGVRRHAREGQGHAPVVVVAGGGGVGAPLPFEHGAQQFIG